VNFYSPGISASAYTLPVATSSTLGGMKCDGTTTTCAGDGTVTAAVPGSVVATINSPGLTNNVGNTLAYAVPVAKSGWYRISCYAVVTSVGTTSTLPTCGVLWFDADTGVQSVGGSGTSTFSTGNTNTGNAIGRVNETNAIQSVMAHVAASTNIQYSTNGYASTGTAMQYALHVVVEYVSP
jgi:hypothetical protein